MLDYTRWPNFTKTELKCSYTGADNPNEKEFTELMDKVQKLRDWYGSPITVTSGYRSPYHPIEARKRKPGQHTISAIDFNVPTQDVHGVLKKCFEMGFKGVGVNMKGTGRFIHIDNRSVGVVWSY